jgi:hypothetical protein
VDWPTAAERASSFRLRPCLTELQTPFAHLAVEQAGEIMYVGSVEVVVVIFRDKDVVHCVVQRNACRIQMRETLRSNAVRRAGRMMILLGACNHDGASKCL